MFAKGRMLDIVASLLRFRNDRAIHRSAPIAAFELCGLILLAGVSLPATAQTISGLGVQATVPMLAGTNSNSPTGVVVDGSGDLFIGDYSNSRVVEMPKGCASTSCESVVPTTGLSEPIGVAVDPTGDLFIADFQGKVFEVPWTGTAWGTQVMIASGLPNPAGVALDKSGNLYVAEYNGGTGGLVVEYPWDGGTTWGTPVTFVNWLSGPFGLAFDAANDLFIADYAGQQVVEVPSSCAPALMSCAVLVESAGFYGGHPKAVAVDSSGNVFVDNTTGDTPSVFAAEVPVTAYGCNRATCLVGVGYGLNSPAGVTLDASGDIYIGDFGNNRVLKVRQSSFNLGTVSVGSTSAAVTAYFDFGAASTLNATPYQVLTEGQSGLDFTDAGGEGGSGCAAASYVAGNTCIVNLDLTPQSAGLVAGALTLTDNTNTRIATLHLSGAGSGPQVTFFTNPEFSQGRGVGLIWGRGLTVDRKKDIFVADSSNNSADEFVATSGYSPSILSTSFNGPTDVAVDGAGNVFVADTGDNAVKELLAPAYTTTNTVGSGFNGPSGVVIDGAGNVFVADTGNHAIKEIVAPAYTVVKTLNSASFTAPFAIAIDTSGNLFVADSSLGTVSELTAASGYVTVTSPITGLAQPSGVAVDASGNVYVADSGHNAVNEFLAANSYAKSTLSTGFTTPSGVALDASGNVYVTAPAATSVGELELSYTPALNFGTVSAGTTTSPQTVTVSNIGNSNLTFPVAAAFDATTQSNGSFKLDASSTCTTSPLTTGTSCTDAIDFSPPAALSYSGTYTLTDNNLNTPSPYATQAIDLGGTGETITFVTTSLSSGTVGVALTPQTLQVSGGSGSYTFAITGGALPAGLGLSSAGTISGTPTAGGTVTGIQVTVTDTSTNATGTKTYSMTIASATITFATASLPDATYNTSYSHGLPAASGGTAPYTYSLFSGSLPPGLSVAPSTGVIFGTPTQGGAYPNFVIRVTDSSTGTGPYSTTQTYSLTVDLANQAATLAVTGMPGTAQAYQATFTVGSSGGSGTGAVTFAASGACSNSAGGALITMGSGTGTCSVSATKAADTDYNSSTSPLATVGAALANQAATLAVTGMPGTAQAYQATFTVGSSGGSGTGAVTFAASGACSNSAGGALITMSSGTGTCSVSATKAADTDYNSSTSPLATVGAALANQAATLAVTGMPGTAQAYQATFTVGSSGGSGTGAVTFAASGACSNSAGGALITMSSGTGTCSVSATKAADTDYNSSTSPLATVGAALANQAATLAVTGMPGTAQAYQATFTVGSSGGSGTGAVTFAASGACSNSAGGALITMSSGTGTCSVSATKAADTDYNSSTSPLATVGAALANQAATLAVTGMPGTAQAYQATFTVGSSGGSGTGAVTFAASGACSNSAGGALITMSSGTGTCSVTATKAADSNYNIATSPAATVSAQPVIAIVNSLPTATAITYGQALSSSTLTGGSASPSAGSFQWTTPAAIPLVGTQTESVIFVPADTVDYSSSAPSTISVTVNPASFTVTVSTDDSGTASNCTPQTTPGHGTDASCSLRDALLEAAAAGGGNITFDATAFGTAETITLANGVLSVPSATTIAGATTGSGASLVNLVTVDGNGASAVFNVSSGVTGASIANLTIQHGNSDTMGGGIVNFGGLTVTGSTISGNTTATLGGGIVNAPAAALTLTSNTISGNTANGGSGGGGGIVNDGTLTMSDDTVTGNSAANSGGGIYNTGTLVMSDSTLSANTAGVASGGGGIDNTGSGTVALANIILSGNTANSANNDFDGVAYTDSGGNIAGVVNGATVNGTAIDLAPLANYGGSTQTLIPLPGSPAICAGLASAIPSGLTTDQRGLPNTNASYPSYAACVDAGAVETNYAFSFTTQPIGVPVATDSPVAVTLTESGNPFQPGITIPLTFTGNGTMTGGSATTSAGVASYTLQFNTDGTGDTLTANLALNPALGPPVAISTVSNTFDVGVTTPPVGVDYSTSGSIAYGTPETLYGYVPATATGTVTFYNNGTTVLGSGTVSGGTATFSSSTLPVGSYSITAAYSGDSNYNPNKSSPLSLTISPPPATMASPTPGTTLTSASTTFTWNPATGSVTGYSLNVGTSPGGADLVNIGPVSGTSVTVNLPTNGTLIYVRLWTIFDGTNYLYNDYTYTEFTQIAAAITSPSPGITLTTAATTFTWSAGPDGTTGYGLNVGTSPGGADLVNIGPLSGPSVTVNLPTNGTLIYVRLWTILNGTTYIYKDYTYTEFTQSGAVITIPTNTSTLTSASTTFTWSAGPAGTTSYGLNVGTTLGGADLVNIGPLSGTSTTVNLPTNGTLIYVRLWTVLNGTTYLSRDFTYTEFTQSGAVITIPTNTSTLTSASTTFTWSAGPAGTTSYGLNVGTSLGGADLVNIGPLSGTSATVTLPTNGAPIYVRLWTVLNGTTYLSRDFTYTEFTQSAAVITIPTNTSTLTSASTTFTWSSGPAGTTGYSLNVGTSPGGADLVNIGPLSGTSVTVNLPTNGTPIYVRLWTILSGPTYLYNDYTYTEFTQ